MFEMMVGEQQKGERERSVCGKGSKGLGRTVLTSGTHPCKHR